MKLSFSFSSRCHTHFVASTVGCLLAIFVRSSEAITYAAAVAKWGLSDERRLAESNMSGTILFQSLGNLGRKLEEGEEEGGESLPNKFFRIKANGLTPDCIDCSVAFTLIKSLLCNSTKAHDTAHRFNLEPDLTYTTDGDGNINDWASTPFEEKPSNSTPVSLEEFVNTDSASSNGGDYNLAVYLYDAETKPIACATLSEATDDEAAYYDELFGAATTTTPTTPANAVDDHSSGDFMLTSLVAYALSFMLSAILVSAQV